MSTLLGFSLPGAIKGTQDLMVATK